MQRIRTHCWNEKKLRDAVQDEQITQDIDDVARFQPSIHTNGQAFPTVLIDDAERTECFFDRRCGNARNRMTHLPAGDA